MKTIIRSRIVAGCLIAVAMATVIGIKLSGRISSASKAAQKAPPGTSRLVVHEWGTFTSIAGKDGVALEWRPLNGSTDLPGFVHTIQETAKGLRHRPLIFQWNTRKVIIILRERLTQLRSRSAPPTASRYSRRSFSSIAAWGPLVYRFRSRSKAERWS